MIKYFIISLVLLSSYASVEAKVRVNINSTSYQFEHNPRLTHVLESLKNKSNIYWPSAALFEDEKSELEEKRKNVLKNIARLANYYQSDKPELAHSLTELEYTIANWQLAKRLNTQIDYDLARIEASSNPQFPDGNYILEISPRKNTVRIFGAVIKSEIVKHLNHADASEYLSKLNRNELASKDYVYVIQADGRNLKVPVAYWNKGHQEVMPGSQIFVPFAESILTPEFKHINQQLVTLAFNRLQDAK